jgi:choline kinase
LERLFDRLADAGVSHGVLVTGYLAPAVELHLQRHPPPFPITLTPNPDYATTNNVVSVLAARLATSADTLVLCDGDVVLHGDALRRLAADPAECALLVDTEARLAHEEMKVILDPRGNVVRLSKALDPERCSGESIGIQKIGGATLAALWSALETLVASGRTDVFYEEAFQRLIDAGAIFRPVPLASDDWTEIDSLEDLTEARARFTGR